MIGNNRDVVFYIPQTWYVYNTKCLFILYLVIVKRHNLKV